MQRDKNEGVDLSTPSKRLFTLLFEKRWFFFNELKIQVVELPEVPPYPVRLILFFLT